MHFDVLFDRGEPNALDDPAYEIYGPLGFPEPPPDRPWIYTNFVQSLDGIVSLKGRHALGADLSQSAEDRWLMDLLRTHADAVLIGVNTLVEEMQQGPHPRGPVFRIMEEPLRELRRKLGRKREINIFVTGAARLELSEYAVFDGDKVDAVILTTKLGASRLARRRSHPHVRVIACGEKEVVPVAEAMRILRHELGLRYLLCEGGPTLYGHVARAGLVDEKFVTVSPVEVGQCIPSEQGPSEAEREDPPKRRPTVFDGAPGFTKETAPWWHWISCRRAGEHQFSRYRVIR
ncbi:MAG: RibD family protein [Terriglobales bacterium]